MVRVGSGGVGEGGTPNVEERGTDGDGEGGYAAGADVLYYVRGTRPEKTGGNNTYTFTYPSIVYPSSMYSLVQNLYSLLHPLFPHESNSGGIIHQQTYGGR